MIVGTEFSIRMILLTNLYQNIETKKDAKILIAIFVFPLQKVPIVIFVFPSLS